MTPMIPPPDAPAGGFRSLTTRLIVWTLLAVGAVYVATVFISNGLARRMAISAAEREAANETEAAVSHVDDVLHSIEERTLALGEALSVLAPGRDDADRLLRSRRISTAIGMTDSTMMTTTTTWMYRLMSGMAWPSRNPVNVMPTTHPTPPATL